MSSETYFFLNVFKLNNKIRFLKTNLRKHGEMDKKLLFNFKKRC